MEQQHRTLGSDSRQLRGSEFVKELPPAAAFLRHVQKCRDDVKRGASFTSLSQVTKITYIFLRFLVLERGRVWTCPKPHAESLVIQPDHRWLAEVHTLDADSYMWH